MKVGVNDILFSALTMHDGKILPGTYVWLATYSNKGTTNILQKGTVTVIH